MKRVVALVAVAVLVVGCSTEAEDVVKETAGNFEDVRSGVLELRVVATSAPDDEGEEAETGFELAGSFQLPEEDQLPLADLEYTDLGSDEPATQGFISTGDQVFLEIDGQAYELPPDQTQSLLGGAGGGDGIFDEAAVDEWLVEPVLHEGDSFEGVEVDRVTGELNVVTTLNDLFEIAERFGPSADFTAIEGDEAQRLENAVQSSRVEIVSGAEDRLMRHLLIQVELGLDEDQELADLLGPLAGTRFTIEMTISEPNEPIEVETPSDAVPLEELGDG